ncbi:MAG: hypothetical protein KKB51_10420 [Candidatus Riflebacteria bacterium]|nr:hypothetical protein [Candidatus Riflebacteria bacterium]
MNLESNGEISNEFFKKLNQQIVQKDNLIKLLQLQIRNLKTQLESGSAGSEGADEVKRALEEKSEEADRLLSELNTQKEQFSALEQQKDEQIKTLAQLLEEQQSAGGASAAELIEDPRLQELETLTSSLREELEYEKQARIDAEAASSPVDTSAEVESLNKEVEQLRAELAAASGSSDEMESLRQAVEVARDELEQSNAAMQHMSEQLQAQMVVSAPGISDEEVAGYNTRVQELEQDIVNLKNLLAEKEETAGGGDFTVDQLELEQLRAKVAELEARPTQPGIDIDEVERLRQESSLLAEATAKLAKLQQEAEAFAETAMKVTLLESEREQLTERASVLESELAALKTAADSSSGEDVDAYKLEIVKLREVIQNREEELARLRVSIDAGQDDSMNDPASREEVEQLTQQVADQMLAIQNFEGILSKTRDQLETKTLEVENLKSKMVGNVASAEKVISIDGDSDIVSSFIDFFDGLDSVIAKNPVPELQMLHQKLLDRLIIPNQISYMPVIAEEFDTQKHYATDYFRSNKFPEKCIVFEVEKGYLKGDAVIKKSKVWVVQNLFDCSACNATQSNPDSRFCHLCGAKIAAPNGLPVDSLPEFEPTPITYQRFADSMIRHGYTDRAREYLMAGLDLDGNFAPIMTRLADILAHESKFEDALELLKKANTIKPDAKTQEMIRAIETKLNIFKQAQSLKLAPEEFEKLLNLIQK